MSHKLPVLGKVQPTLSGRVIDFKINIYINGFSMNTMCTILIDHLNLQPSTEINRVSFFTRSHHIFNVSKHLLDCHQNAISKATHFGFAGVQTGRGQWQTAQLEKSTAISVYSLIYPAMKIHPDQMVCSTPSAGGSHD